MIIGTITATNASVPMGFVKSLLSTRGYEWIIHEGPSIPMNRNAVFERARIEKQDLLFIDSDMVFTLEDVKKMEELLKTKDIVSGVCVMGWKGNPPAIFKKENNAYRSCAIEKDMFEIDACGAAFLGISSKVIEYLTEPFEPIIEEKYGQKHGEDISFCIRAKQAGFKIFCEPSLLIGHIKSEVKYYA
jgi:GT2 family glycosyltransferase